MAVLTVTPLSFGTRTAATIPLYAGFSLTANAQNASAGGDSFTNNGKTFLVIINEGASPITITIPCVKANDQGVTESVVSTITNATQRYYGPFDVSYFNDANGRVSIAYSDVTSVLCCVFSASNPGRGY